MGAARASATQLQQQQQPPQWHTHNVVEHRFPGSPPAAFFLFFSVVSSSRKPRPITFQCRNADSPSRRTSPTAEMPNDGDRFLVNVAIRVLAAYRLEVLARLLPICQ